MKSISYRIFADADVTYLLDLMQQLGYEHSRSSLLGNVEAVRKHHGEVFVAEHEGRVVACASTIIDIRLAAGKRGEICSVVVDSDHRGKGIGKGLIATCESWLKNSVDRVTIRANSIREEAHEFYQGLGYTMLKTQAVFNKNI